jgi:hypothetical protein
MYHQAYEGPIIAIIAGIPILAVPRPLSYIMAICLIIFWNIRVNAARLEKGGNHQTRYS